MSSVCLLVHTKCNLKCLFGTLVKFINCNLFVWMSASPFSENTLNNYHQRKFFTLMINQLVYWSENTATSWIFKYVNKYDKCCRLPYDNNRFKLSILFYISSWISLKWKKYVSPFHSKEFSNAAKYSLHIFQYKMRY